MMTEPRTELVRNTLGVLFIGALIMASAWILRPFIPGLIWAAMIVVATWPLMVGVQRRFGNRRAPAVAVMTLAMLLVFVVPVGLAISVLAEHAGDATKWVQSLSERSVPDAPSWLGSVPLVGKRAVASWADAQASGVPALIARADVYTRDLSRWLIGEVGTFGLLFAQFLLIVILSVVFYSGGEGWAAWMRSFGRRLADERGEQAVILAGQAIRGVALGVVVTALIQAGLGGIGLAIAGVPFPLLLTAIMLGLCIAQLGPILVLIPSTIWLFATDQTGWGSFLLVWSLLVGGMDNFLRPVLIRRGVDLPLLLIIVGVIGGLLAFGLVGLFVGPVVLAVTFTLVDAWVTERPAKQ